MLFAAFLTAQVNKGGQCEPQNIHCSEVGWAAGNQHTQVTQTLWPGFFLEILMGEDTYYS